MRVATMHVLIHLMLVVEGGGERMFDRRAVALLVYALLGVAVYHLIVRRLVSVRRIGEAKPEKKPPACEK